MSFKTLEVNLENGRVLPKGQEPLPSKARALLTILDSQENDSHRASPNGGLNHFLTSDDFSITPEQFRVAMEADAFDQ